MSSAPVFRTALTFKATSKPFEARAKLALGAFLTPTPALAPERLAGMARPAGTTMARAELLNFCPSRRGSRGAAGAQGRAPRRAGGTMTEL